MYGRVNIYSAACNVPGLLSVPQRSHVVRNTALILRMSRLHGLLQYKEIYFTMLYQLYKMKRFQLEDLDP
jgi:hypothetical protein